MLSGMSRIVIIIGIIIGSIFLYFMVADEGYGDSSSEQYRKSVLLDGAINDLIFATSDETRVQYFLNVYNNSSNLKNHISAFSENIIKARTDVINGNVRLRDSEKELLNDLINCQSTIEQYGPEISWHKNFQKILKLK